MFQARVSSYNNLHFPWLVSVQLTIHRFVNDLHRWASLIMPSDKNVFVETASCLWGNRPWDAMWAEADNLPDSKKQFYLQELVDNLVSSSGLFDKHYQTSSSFRLRSMRHRRSPMAPFAHGPDERIPLTEWRPLDQHHVQDKLHTDDLRPPDPVDSTSMLARITVIMAGAIFGAILLYLCRKYSGSTALRFRLTSLQKFSAVLRFRP